MKIAQENLTNPLSLRKSTTSSPNILMKPLRFVPFVKAPSEKGLMTMIKKCSHCGKEFTTTNATKFCSNTCRRRYQGSLKVSRRHGNETLCWTCKNACGSCSWSRSLTPVKGWEAKKIKVKGNFYTGEVLDSFIVKNCPEYIPDGKEEK